MTIPDDKITKYAQALRAMPGAMYDPKLTDKQLVNKHVSNLVKSDYENKVNQYKQSKVTKENFDD